MSKQTLWVSAEPIDVMSHPERNSQSRFLKPGYDGLKAAGSLDHDFVIGGCRRNKLKDRPNCNVGARVREREDEWTGLMRSAISGDSAAYHRLLKAVTPVLRAAARRGLARAGQPVDQSEDIVQDILLAVHLKRHTWDADAPFAPWLFAIARNKLIDALRRRGRRVFVNSDDFAETLQGEPAAETAPARSTPSSRRCRCGSATCCSRSRSTARRSRIPRRNSR
jgi:RNA polymerase sigma factor (sigma-70 family)